jgi:hypothetical protein
MMTSPQPEEDYSKIKFLGEMQKLRPEPGDIFVLSCERLLNRAQVDQMQRAWQQIMPNNKLIIFDSGMKLGLISPVSDTTKS